MIQAPGWQTYGWLKHGFSQRAGGCSTVYAQGGAGELNLGFTSDDSAAAVSENRAQFLRAVAGDGVAELATVRQVHGTAIRILRRGDPGLHASAMPLIEADGVISDVPGLMLGILAADCVPVLLADTRLRVVAAFHAGWRGTAARIVEQGIARMHHEFGTRPGDLVAAVGPAIGPCCYAVGEEVQQVFARNFAYASELLQKHQESVHLDLAEANRRQMMAAGMAFDRIWMARECTACARIEGRRKYFSHRAEAGRTGRAMGIIGLA